jgi:DNA polymerase bacteriophage-type
MTTILHGDFETRSEVELSGDEGVGLYNYSIHPSTRALMFAWAINDGPVHLWEILKDEPIPAELNEALSDPAVLIAAWNSPFERHIFKYVLKRDIPIYRWAADPQASARYLSLPDDLETAGFALNLPGELRKDERGEHLIKVFSKLTIPRKARAKKGVIAEPPKPYFRDFDSDPFLWDEFGQYCIQDVAAEREIGCRLSAFKVYPLPERELNIWKLDQKINDFGMPTDLDFVRKNRSIGIKAAEDANETLKVFTGLEKPNSPKQMLEWVRERGYEYNTLRKEYVNLVLDNPNSGLNPGAREALEIRKIACSTSYKKLETIERQLSPDHRLRNQFIFMGSSRAARWSSGASQLHNMARPIGEFEEEEILDEARQLIYAENYQGLVSRFGDRLVMPAVKSNIRSSFVAPRRRRLNVSDLNAIETRVAAWLAGCKSLLDGFRYIKDFDPYLEFASKMTGIPYEQLARDKKSDDKKVKVATKRHRQIAKPGVLGCVYRLGPGGWGRNKYGDPIKIGLWGYAENMGVKAPLEQWQEVVRIFRESYSEIKQLWYDFENCVRDVLKGSKNATASLGPGGCIKFDKINRKGQNPILRIQLPSGRYLHYVDARLEDTKMPWTKKDVVDGKIVETDVYRPTLCYAGVNQDTKQWEPNTKSHGGKLTENVVQSIARDVLAEGMLRADEFGFQICGHVHDEIVTETEDSPFEPDYKDLEKLMSIPMPWAPTLPLGAEGYSGYYYHK